MILHYGARYGSGLRVCFSDFNREVLDQVTIPNVQLNVEERHWPLAEFFSGDWGSLSPLLEEVMVVTVFWDGFLPGEKGGWDQAVVHMWPGLTGRVGDRRGWQKSVRTSSVVCFRFEWGISC